MSELDFKFPNFEQILKLIPESRLADVPVNVGFEASIGSPVDFGKFTLGVGAESRAGIRLLGKKGDQDELGVFGVPPEEVVAGTLAPPLGPDGTRGWLRYAVTGGMSAKPGMSLPYLKLSADLRSSITCADYHAHELKEVAHTAIGADIKRLRLPFVEEHVRRLCPGEAMALVAQVGMSMELKVSYSDAYTAALSKAVALLQNTHILDVEFDASVSLGGRLSITDRFTLIFSRPAAGRLRVDVLKAANRGGDVNFAVQAKIEAGGLKEIVDKVADQIVKALGGSGSVEALLANPPVSQEEQKMLAALMRALGVTKSDSLPDAWKDLRKRLEDAVTLRMQFGFEYDYSRMKEHATLVSLEFEDAALREVHGPLLEADVGRALEVAGPAALRSFFQQDSMVWKEAWGFSLSFLKWTLLSSRDERELREVVEYNAPQGTVPRPRRVAYLGARSYKDDYFGLQERFAVDFRCDMKDFVAEPTADQFRYGLYFLLRKEGHVPQEQLSVLVDSAAIWRVVPEGERDGVLARVCGLVGSRKYEVRVEFKVDDELFRALAQRFASGDVEVASRAFARAMPNQGLRIRSDLALRERAYAPLWEEYLRRKGDGWSAAGNQVAGVVAETLRKSGLPQDVVDAAYNDERSGGFGTFQDLLVQNAQLPELSAPLGGVSYRWEEFRKGMGMIASAVERRAPADSFIREAFRHMSGAWSQLFYVRALGALAVSLVSKSELNAIQRTLTVTVDDRKVLVLSSAQ